MDVDEQQLHYYPQTRPPSRQSSQQPRYAPLHPTYNHSRLSASLEPTPQPFPEAHRRAWSQTPPEEQGWVNSPRIGTSNLPLGSCDDSQLVQHNTSSNELARSLKQANAKIAYLEGQLHSITQAFNRVVDKVPELLDENSSRTPALAQNNTSTEGSVQFVVMKPMGPKPKALDVADYPDVRFWTLAAWKKYVADRKGVTSNSENYTNHYLEDSEGKSLDKSQVNKIHAEAYSLWFFVRDAHRLPATWGVAAADIVDFYRTEITRRCPEVCLCEDDWKSNYLATQLFSTFKRSHGAGKGTKVKEEAKEIAMEGDEAGPSKRKIANPATFSTSKKPRTSVGEKKERDGKDRIVSGSEPAAAPLPPPQLPPPPSIVITDASQNEAPPGQAIQRDLDSEGNPATHTIAPPPLAASRPKLKLKGALFADTPTPAPVEKNMATDSDVLPSHLPDDVPISEQAVIGSIDASPAEQTPQHEDAQVPIANVIPQSSGDGVDTASGGQGSSIANTGGPRGSKVMQPLKKRDAKGRCSDQWCRDNPTGTVTQFNCYWNTIKDTAVADRFAPPKAPPTRRTTRKSGAA